MTSNPLDDLAKKLAAEAERQRLEAEAKAAESAPTPDVSAALEKLTQTLAKATTVPAPHGGTASVADNKKTR